MCELLNRIWSRPRGEWTRVLRRELPALAAEIVEELLHGDPELSELVDDNDAVDGELLRQRVEGALLTALGYRDPADGADAGAEAGADAGAEAGDGSETDPHTESGTEPETEESQVGAQARQELFAALTDDRAASASSLAELAQAAGWPLPVAVRAIALAAPGETRQLAAVLEDALVGVFAGRPCLLVPTSDPDARTPLELPLRGRCAAVGHAVPLRDAASSLRWALRLLALTPARGGLDARTVFVDDHLSTLLLLQDEPLAHALAARWLRPLADLTPRQSERLEVTLLAWLEGGGAPEAAKALSVHPQTVRYRMRQLEKLFGTGLRDPRTRFELEMALRSRRLMAQVRRRHSRVGRRTPRVVTADFTPVVVDRMARVNGL
ncbi:helix-turn-helix domain-containing protein [Streptomyces sp. NBC_01351]|uniref:PucR family transcriptional regulator n=1 Tax=Streptomyces sp. NBC_01351 TaxID=2903833 RepID=UPI002E353ED5|nr:helix-turn-helix domain-containing protein [Streptomyces sp. NBC_01351]